MNKALAGIGKKERAQLSKVLKASGPVITPSAAGKALKLNQNRAAQLLALWQKKGWLSRVKRGVYVPISLLAESTEVMVDEPWVLAEALFNPCYIGGWSAAEHWDFTEQIFNSTMVFTSRKVSSKEVQLKGARFTVKIVKKERLFGIKRVWVQNQKIAVSDPTKTIVDAFNDPSVVGGIRMAVEMLDKYMFSEHKNMEQLFSYSNRMKNTAIFKRFGFVFEMRYPGEEDFIKSIKSNLKEGYSQLDPASPGKCLITAWRLWVPISMKKGIEIDNH